MANDVENVFKPIEIYIMTKHFGIAITIFNILEWQVSQLKFLDS